MAEKAFKWYAMRAVSGKEAKLKEYIETELSHNDFLAAHVREVYVPMMKQASLKNGKRVVKEKPSLPGFIFVEAQLIGDTAHTLRFMPNCLGFLGGLDAPTPVRQQEIDRMKGAAEESELVDEVKIPFLVDESVRVTDGPFSGFIGIIEKIDSERHTLNVMVKIFGRNTPLELSYQQVERIDAPEVKE